MTLTTPFDLAQRYVGIREIAGGRDHPLVQWWLSLCGFSTDTPDEVAWCSAFLNGIMWEMRLPRTKSAAARSWLGIGTVVNYAEARSGFDVCILKRGSDPQPDATVLNAPGHVGFFAGLSGGNILLLAGNQNDGVCILPVDHSKLLGIRRVS